MSVVYSDPLRGRSQAEQLVAAATSRLKPTCSEGLQYLAGCIAGGLHAPGLRLRA